MTAEEVAEVFTRLSGEEALSVEKLVGGSPNPSWGVRTASSRYAVRLYSSVRAELQGALLRFLASNGYPVPTAVYEGSAGDYRLLAVSWLAGVPLGEALTATPEQVGALGEAFGILHARLHALKIPPALEKILPRLEGFGAGTALLHLDYHPFNALVEAGRFSGIIDWDNLRLGDARADVARTLSILAADPAIRALPLEVRQGVRTFRRAYCAGYCQVAGPESLSGMRPFLAWAGDFMLRDLGGRHDAGALEPVRRWTARWQG